MPVSTLSVAITAREQLAEDVVGLTLAAEDGGRLPDWTPGAHLTLALPAGQRCYSLCGDRWDPTTYRVAVRRDPRGGGGSVHLHDKAAVGDVLVATAPRNAFAMVPARAYLFVAGGIGITPLVPMIDQAVRSGLPWRLLYAGRSRGTMAFLPGLEAHGDAVEVFARDQGARLDLATHAASVGPGTAVLCCGPAGLQDEVTARLAPLARTVRTERFTGAPVAAAARPFAVRLARSGRAVAVAQHQSLLAALRDAGAGVGGACLDGVCGSCRVGVLRGEVDHQDRVLREPGDDPTDMYPCVSRCHGSELVLDL